MVHDFGKLCKCLHLFETTFLLHLILIYFLLLFSKYWQEFYLNFYCQLLPISWLWLQIPTLSSARCLSSSSHARCVARAHFLPNQQMLPLSTEFALPRFESHFYFFFHFFRLWSCRLRHWAMPLIWKQICIIIFARFFWARARFLLKLKLY